MSTSNPSRPSFSPSRRWKIGFDVVLRTLLVVGVVVMVNYLAAQYVHRFYMSSETQMKLSSRTLDVLHSMTNSVKVTLYFDTKDEFFPDVDALLEEYHAVNKNITIRTVDYVRDPGEAEKVKEHYKLAGSADKDLVIFDSNGRVKMFSGKALTKYTLEMVPNKKELHWRKKPIAFIGEKVFTAMLLALENPHPLKAYFVQGHGEPSITDDGPFGYMKFASTLEQDYVTVTNLDLGNGPVPMDCNLLIIAGPAAPFTRPELHEIDQYLNQGGRLMVLFDYASLKRSTMEPITGLEPILQHWGVNVLPDIVQDPNHTITGQDIKVQRFGKHPIVNSLTGFSLQMILPRPVEKINQDNSSANAPEVTELAFTSPEARLANAPGALPQSYPLIAAVEQKPAAGIVKPRGTTRIVVAGDSIFLGNHYIQGGANRDFLNSAANWLLERPQLISGIGPRPVTEFRLLLARQQKVHLYWLLLGALPGGVLCFGCLVWLVRRK